MCGELLEALTLFQTKMFFLPYFRPDVKSALILHFRPDPIQEPPLVVLRKRSRRASNSRSLLKRFFQETMIKASSSKDRARPECTKRTLFQTKMIKVYILFQSKTASKPCPLVSIHTYITYLRGCSPRNFGN